jgi:hypothetical protein
LQLGPSSKSNSTCIFSSSSSGEKNPWGINPPIQFRLLVVGLVDPHLDLASNELHRFQASQFLKRNMELEEVAQ